MLDALAVAAQTGGASVEDRGVLRRRSVFGPVPVLFDSLLAKLGR